MKRALAALPVAALVGCGGAAPSPELVSARGAYDEAAESQARDIAPADLLSARQALDVAERAYEEDENSGRARTLAYIAHRKALGAMAAARGAAAKKQRLEAEREYEGLLEATRRSASERAQNAETNLGKTEGELAKTRAELEQQRAALEAERAALEKEKQARSAAEKQAADALAQLNDIAKVQHTSRGTIITIPGAVLFASGESALLGLAEGQLRQVTRAVVAQGKGRQVSVEGHTDSQGGDEINRRLSLARAESVRRFLIAGGLDANIVRAVGRGESQPIASNRTAEGRALNRRVEIVVEEP